MKPIARKEELFLQEMGEELLVYDRERSTSHCLNPIAARVWQTCDGQHTIPEIAEKLGQDRPDLSLGPIEIQDLVRQVLDELESRHLLLEYQSPDRNTARISRRKALKNTVLVGGFALGALSPSIRSIVAPTPAMASSAPPPHSPQGGEASKPWQDHPRFLEADAEIRDSVEEARARIKEAQEEAQKRIEEARSRLYR
ncbi:PqqD family peptide modification chaperone [Pannus brasiliensis CCIBt3594]|uniref:PqqD family peptide modification chaperone n=1 Tax=Pannus brasiliensis CCIBt3594 TaxID=1427578 RepID=A0AAW9QIJ5_9CHRO